MVIGNWLKHFRRYFRFRLLIGGSLAAPLVPDNRGLIYGQGHAQPAPQPPRKIQAAPPKKLKISEIFFHKNYKKLEKRKEKFSKN